MIHVASANSSGGMCTIARIVAEHSIGRHRRGRHVPAILSPASSPRRNDVGHGSIDYGRRGVATIELAICLPVLVMLAFGSIETTNAIFVKEHLTSAAYEGARAATVQGQTAAEAAEAANNVLTQLGISGGTVTISPTIVSSTPVGTRVTVTVNAPFGPNACMPSFIIGNLVTDIGATVVMIHQ